MGHYTGKVVVVTGAASGIGRALALELARRGAAVAISDVDVQGLDATAEQARALGATVRTDVLDVSQRELVGQYATDVVEQFGVVNVVINNAGIAFTGTTLEENYKDLERIMDVDFWGVVNGTKEFQPHLIASGDGHVVNISSVFGLFAVPSQGAYNAAKFAVRGFTEALAMEMRIGGLPVGVTCVHPGGIKTNIARNADQAAGRDHDALASSFDKMARTSPDKAAKVILDGVEKGRAKVLIGGDAWLLDKMVRVAGSRYQGLVTRFASRTGL
ncbi:MAG: SDR family NAD(P)-dependent oxidoreductase [Aeromicrobium erythreum]